MAAEASNGCRGASNGVGEADRHGGVACGARGAAAQELSDKDLGEAQRLACGCFKM